MNRYLPFTVEEPKYHIVQRGILDTKMNVQYIEDINNNDFIKMGFAPKPKNRIQQFKHDILHGLLMNYSLLSILEYSFRNLFNYMNGWKPHQ